MITPLHHSQHPTDITTHITNTPPNRAIPKPNPRKSYHKHIKTITSSKHISQDIVKQDMKFIHEIHQNFYST